MDLSTQERLRFFESAPDDLTGPLHPKGADAFLDVMLQHPQAAQERIHTELAVLSENEAATRTAAAALLTSSRTAVLGGALIALGQIANDADVPVIIPFLTHNNAAVREAAAVALARIGDGALDALTRSFRRHAAHAGGDHGRP